MSGLRDIWVKCSEALPPEKDSMFKRFKGTERWTKSMWARQSEIVDVTVLYPDGQRRTGTGKTRDGKWSTDMGPVEKGRVIAWRPRPEPYGGEA